MITDNRLINALQKMRLAYKTLADANNLISEIIAEKTHEEIERASDADFDDAELVAICNVFNGVEDVQKKLNEHSLAVTDMLSKSLMEYMDGK